jgi:hypothetical protein
VRNKRLAPLGRGDEPNPGGDKVFIHSKIDPNQDQTDMPSVTRPMPSVNPDNLIVCTLLKDTEENGQRFRARIVKVIIDKEAEMHKDPDYIKFLCEVDGDVADEILTYN